LSSWPENKRFLEPTVIVSEQPARPVDEPRPGKLIGCRHQSAHSIHLTGRSTWIDDQDAIFTLPDCPASEILRNRFGCLSNAALIEEWVSAVICEHDRRQVYGQTATERAKKRLRVRHCEDHDLTHYGELRLDGSQLKAFIRTGQHQGRTTFTLAHELGHAALHLMNPELDQRAIGTERLCDLFAAELTMPVALVEDIWYRTPDASPGFSRGVGG
jgi:hypothetical protein